MQQPWLNGQGMYCHQMCLSVTACTLFMKTTECILTEATLDDNKDILFLLLEITMKF